ncbi:MAG: PilZ domain-containing protein [Candidatus Acidiferrum sp.]
MINRRGAPRFPIALAAELTEPSSKTTSSGRTSDISKTGCYVDSLRSFAAGTKVIVRLTRGTETFEALAKVVYVTPRLGMGIAFDEPVPQAQMEILERFIALASQEVA